MAKSVPALDRALRILGELAARPADALTLSELARAADVNLSTCHSIVMALTEASYLLRHEPAKTYTLGPAVVEIGAAALAQYPGLLAARQEGDALMRRFELGVIIGGRAGDELLVLEDIASPHVTPDSRKGFRGPMAPPLGRLFMAWEPDDAILAWLQRLSFDEDSDEVRYYRDALRITREQGHIVALDGTISELVIRLAVQLARATTQHERLDIAVRMADLVRDEEYAHLGQRTSTLHRQDVVGVPVFGADGRTALTLSVVGRPGDIAQRNVPVILRALTAAARRIAATLGGHTPTSADGADGAEHPRRAEGPGAHV